MWSTQFDSLLRSEIKIDFVFGSTNFFAEKCITNENCANWENCWQRNTAMYSAKDRTRCTVTVSWFSTLIHKTSSYLSDSIRALVNEKFIDNENAFEKSFFLATLFHVLFFALLLKLLMYSFKEQWPKFLHV